MSPFGAVDWTPRFRADILNGALPYVAIALSVVALAARGVANRTRRADAIAHEVAQLNPASSHFCESHAAPAPDGPRPTAAQRVFQAENAALIDAALALKDAAPLSEAVAAQRRRRILRHARVAEATVAAVVLATHAVGVATSHGIDWERMPWLLVWIYITALCAAAARGRRSYFWHVLALVVAYVLVTASNLRSALIAPALHAAWPLTAVQLLLATVLLACCLLTPLTQRPPKMLRAIYATMHPRTVFGHLRTSVPTPQHPADGEDPGITPSFSKDDAEALPPPEEHASLLSRALFQFVQPVIWKHFWVPITLPAVPQLMPGDRAAAVTAMFRAQCAKSAPARSLWMRLLRYFAPQLTKQVFFSFCSTILTVTPIFCLSHLLSFFSERASAPLDAQPPLHLGVLYAFGMFISQSLLSVSQSQALMTGRHICIQTHALLTFEILSKIMRRSILISAPSAPPTAGAHEAGGQGTGDRDGDTQQSETDEDENASDGRVTNLVSVDVSKVSEFAAYIHFVVPEQPLSVVLGIIYLVALLGRSGVVGLLVLILALPAQGYLSKKFMALQKRMLRATDDRLGLAGEVLVCIKTVKFFAWEQPFLTRMMKTRARELGLLRRWYGVSVLYHLVFEGTPMFVTLTTFAAHTMLFRQPLTAQKAFTALALFNTLRRPLSDLPTLLQWLFSALVSLNRVGAFLQQPDTHKYEQLLGAGGADASEPASSIGFTDASFSYSAAPADDAFVLRDLNCAFPAGALSVVVGPVGCGKTSLLLALLGEIARLQGSTHLPCPISRSLVMPDPTTHLAEATAYCSQSPWLLGTTVRENILFGAAFDEARYGEVLRACALEPDLQILEYNDETEVGEKGTALSGGQKARIALARAFYSNARHVLVDDALSAVDAHTARHLVQHCFQGPLAKGRTIVLVTHAVSLTFPAAAYAVALDRGRVSAQGTPAELLASGMIRDFVAEHAPEKQDLMHDACDNTSQAAEDEKKRKMQRAQEQRAMKELADKNEEKIAREKSSGSLYWIYLRSVSERMWIAVVLWGVLLVLFIVIRTTDVASGAWLRKWAQSYESTALYAWQAFLAWVPLLSPSGDEADRTWYYLTRYAAIVCGFIAISALANLVLYYGSLRASARLYSGMLTALLRATPQFYDKTPIGRITNRLAKDMEEVDQELSPVARMTLENLISLLAIVAVICWATPQFVFVLAVVAVMYYMIGAMYLASSRDLKRIESIQRSPLYTLVGETMAGTVTIRAYSDCERVARRCLTLVDKWNRAFLFLWYENRWLSICCDVAGAAVTFTAALFLLTNNSDAALAGFTLSYAITLVDVVLWLVRLYSVVEINMNCVERIAEYMDIPSEHLGGTLPPAHWPTDQGLVRVTDLAVRYGPEFPLALNGVTFDIRPGEMIGIVGRTGSGKSTLSLSFFRFLEAERGSIVIDGIDIATVPLEHLRKQLTIIPQDSQLFRGTVRSNLDPFGTCDDADMWFALQRCQLASAPASAQPGVVKTLDDCVEQGGANFSAGQRQLLSLARGLLKLRNSRILILDESTANLDSASDALIQKTIREQMAPGATILTVAHRLKTIIDYDKVLVLDNGRVLQYDLPANLLEDPSSAFYQLCANSGDFDALADMARAKAVALKRKEAETRRR
ncbi:hypothetical protein MSPP1_000247 [Malassezia sp. CBS 17886]|nr:hypothetical protein MSPP1_000247 [Malassezia sp. CBS 17886]